MTRRALCIGINAYPAPYQLNGCVADAAAWGAYLASRGFAVSYLTDGAATQRGIVEALLQHVEMSRPGDVLTVVYSGHGTRAPDLDGDEGDGWDEAIVPVDGLDGRLVIDDDLFAIFSRLRPRVGLTLIADSCHSGTVARLVHRLPKPTGIAALHLQVYTRFLPLPADAVRAFRAVRGAEGSPVPDAARAVRPESALGWVTLSACAPTEVALESSNPDGTVSGDFTRAALAVLRAGPPSLRHDTMMQRVRRAIGGEQTPEAEPRALLKRTLVTVPR